MNKNQGSEDLFGHGLGRVIVDGCQELKGMCFLTLDPFPKIPFRIQMNLLQKLRLFPLHVPVTSSHRFVGWVCLLVEIKDVMCFRYDYVHACMFGVI